MTTPKDEKGAEPALLRDFKGSTEDALRMALDMLHDETADYINRNNLGGYENHCMRLAREALALRATPPGELDSARVREALAGALLNFAKLDAAFDRLGIASWESMRHDFDTGKWAVAAALASLKGEAP
jgi:hypothetical protein